MGTILGHQRGHVVVVGNRDARLREDRAGVKLRVRRWMVCRLGVPQAERPAGRVRSTVPGQGRVMEIDRAEARKGQYVSRDPPGEAPTDDQVGLQGSQHRRPTLRMVGDDDVDPRGTAATTSR